MSYLLDSDCLIELLNERARAQRLAASLLTTGAATSIVCYGEVYEGVLFGANRQRHELGLDRLLQWIEVIGLDRETMQVFAELRGRLRSTGMPLSDLDLLIAATAVRHGLTLLTRNVGHFARIDRLTISDPFAE